MSGTSKFFSVKKLLPCFLAALLCFSLFPLSAFADANVEAGDKVDVAAASGSSVGGIHYEEGADSAEDAGIDEDGALPLPDDDSADVVLDETDASSGDSVQGVEPDDAGSLILEEGIAPENEAGDETLAAPAAKPSLGFVYIDEAVLAEGESQNVVFGLSDDSMALERATLRYFTVDGEKSVEASEYDHGAALFEIADLGAGEYQLLGVDYVVSGCDEVFTESLKGGAYSFEVQALPNSGTIEVSALALDGQGDLVEDASIEEAIGGGLLITLLLLDLRLS